MAGRCHVRGLPRRRWPEGAGPVDRDWSGGSGVWAPAMQGANRVGGPAGGGQGCRERGPRTGAIVG